MSSTGKCAERKHIDVSQYVAFLGKVLLLGIAIAAMIILLSQPTLAAPYGTHNLPLQPSMEQTPQPTATSLNNGASSGQNSPNQQANDTGVASDTITTAQTFVNVAGIILGLLALIAAVATGIGVFEVGRIRQFRKQFEDELNQLKKRIETESQRYVEASYYYSEGIKQYKAGDNGRAIENFKQAQKYLPKSSRILERIGRAYNNLNEDQMAYEYLRQAVEADRDYEPAQRSLALYYRYFDREEAIRQLKSIIEKNPKAYEAWDLLGLCYRDHLQQDQQLGSVAKGWIHKFAILSPSKSRAIKERDTIQLIKDQEIIDKAIRAHEEARKINERPETEFYLGILLFFSPTGDKKRARELLISAAKRVEEQGHEVRIRDAWKKLILVGPLIVEGKKAETLRYLQNMLQYITTRHIYLGVESHLRFLLEGTGHSDWRQEVMDIVNTKES